MKKIASFGALACSLLCAGILLSAQSNSDQATSPKRGDAPTDVTRAAAQQQIVANEKAVIDAIVMKNDPKTFHSHVLQDGYALGDAGPMKVADFDKTIAQMATDCKIAKWSMSDSTFYWLNPTTVVHMFKTNVDGTCQGQSLPSVWSSTVWSNKDGKWLGAFHQETVIMPPPQAAPKK
jgi:hypothetical protein